jgi:hypothetical protein
MKLVAACAALMLAVGISIIYKDRIAVDPVAVMRQCAPAGGLMRAEWRSAQCTKGNP